QAPRGGLLVYDYNRDVAYRVLDSVASTQPENGLWIVVDGQHVWNNTPMMTGADGIALSCDGSWLYYCPLTSRPLFRIATKYLRDNTLSRDQLAQYVQVCGLWFAVCFACFACYVCGFFGGGDEDGCVPRSCGVLSLSQKGAW